MGVTSPSHGVLGMELGHSLGELCWLWPWVVSSVVAWPFSVPGARIVAGVVGQASDDLEPLAAVHLATLTQPSRVNQPGVPLMSI
jgi:hypothetical protein